jgi:hypothetical protein
MELVRKKTMDGKGGDEVDEVEEKHDSHAE